MLSPLSLRSKITYLLTAMGAVTLAGGGVMLWYTLQIDTTLSNLVKKEIVLYRIARDLELALANQKGNLTYYLIDGDGKWLRSLGQYREFFKNSIDRASLLELDTKQKESLTLIEKQYSTYVKIKDAAIADYQKNPSALLENISTLHETQREVFFRLLEQCSAFSKYQWKILEDMRKNNHELSSHLRAISYLAIVLFMGFGSLFLYILYHQILSPIRGLAIETGSSPQDSSKDEVVSLSQSLKGMMRDFDATHDALARSRKHLLQSERMAMVGELAAGVAHTIRNPFTSIKMRMFSLTRSLDLVETQHEDLKVISDEIGRIDRIVQNFLEFARPPKLKLAEWQICDLIQSVITLLEYRLKEYDAELRYQPQPQLPRVMIDADRLKEALVNLITNSCEAMGSGGTIDISESVEHDQELGESIVITVRDSGPGIPESLHHKIMTPFFTTKEEGSGLGLSIVNRIVREHKGKLVLSPSSETTAEFIIKIPLRGHIHGSDTDH